MAISPNSFFNSDATAILASNAERDRADARLSSDFQLLGATIIRLTSELGNFSKFIVSGQKTENKILDDYAKDVQVKSSLARTGILGAPEGGSQSMGESIAGSAGMVGNMPNMSVLGGAALAGGGIAAAIAGLMGGGEPGGGPGAKPGSVPAGSLGEEKLVSLAQSAGFKGKDAATMAAIAMAESGGVSSKLNNNRRTGDLSYGLWQINMIDELGPERRKQFGISSNEQLFDPATNANAAKIVKERSGFSAWSVYKSGIYKQYLPAAERALNKIESAPKSSSKPPAKPSNVSVSPTSSEMKTQTLQVQSTPSSQVASSIVPKSQSQEPMIAVLPTSNKTTMPTTSPVRDSTGSSGGSPDSGSWLTAISRLSMGIASMG